MGHRRHILKPHIDSKLPFLADCHMKAVEIEYGDAAFQQVAQALRRDLGFGYRGKFELKLGREHLSYSSFPRRSSSPPPCGARLWSLPL